MSPKTHQITVYRPWTQFTANINNKHNQTLHTTTLWKPLHPTLPNTQRKPAGETTSKLSHNEKFPVFHTGFSAWVEGNFPATKLLNTW